MACTDYANGIEAMANYAFRDAIFCQYQNALGGPEFALLVVAPLSMYMYAKTESMAMLFVVTLLLGGLFLPYIAPVGLSGAGVLLLFVLGVGPVILLWKLGRL